MHSEVKVKVEGQFLNWAKCSSESKVENITTQHMHKQDAGQARQMIQYPQ